MKILYIHGLSSSGSSGTAERLRRLLPQDTILSSDLPVEHTFALYGTDDDTVNCQKEYEEHYTQWDTFPVGHRLTEDTIREYLLPVIERQRCALGARV